MIGSESIADVEFSLNWKSGDASHREVCFRRINFWRDIMPEDLYSMFMGSFEGDRFETRFRAGEFVPLYNQHGEMKIKRSQFNDYKASIRVGRFYPRGLLKGLPGLFPENIEPFRCTYYDGDSFHADFNHPMAGREVQIEAMIRDVNPVANTIGGECAVLSEVLVSGPGMQARWKEKPTHFISHEDDFKREIEEDDSFFYHNPRFVMHIDTLAASTLSRLYAKYLKPGYDVLDLMTSCESHIPENIELNSVTGLGMNMDEMLANPVLTKRLVHDLNKNHTMPFDSDSFDTVLCSLSVEYLIRPVDVFAEVARILKPGGRFVVSFSNRWFPPKAIRLWAELHDFEKMGLVLDYFMKTGLFENLETFSSRGYPRPYDDKYFPSLRLSDPVYAVAGEKM